MFTRLLIFGLSLMGVSLCVEGATVIRVTATTTHVADMVRGVAGDAVEVSGLMGPGVDPHLYKPTSQDVRKLNNADVVFYSGLLLEGRMADLLDKARRRGRRVYAVTDNIPHERLIYPSGKTTYPDPHVWMDAELWITGIDVVVTSLSEVDPANAGLFAERGEALKQDYLATHAWALDRVQTLPESQRILITSHDAFNYFGRAYGFKVVGIQGISTVSEAGLADIANTVDLIQKHQLPAVFVESSVAPAAIERVSRDAGVQIGGQLYSDALGQPGELLIGPDGTSYDAGTWVGMLKHNVNTIVAALSNSSSDDSPQTR